MPFEVQVPRPATKSIHACFALALAAMVSFGCKLTPRDPASLTQTAQRAPEFDLVDHTGKHVNSTHLLANGPLVVVFYRGHW